MGNYYLLWVIIATIYYYNIVLCLIHFCKHTYSCFPVPSTTITSAHYIPPPPPQGDIATSSGTFLHVWTVNGAEIARVNTAVGASDRMQQILCVAFSQSNEWDPDNVIMTGSTDGVVRVGGWDGGKGRADLGGGWVQMVLLF